MSEAGPSRGQAGIVRIRSRSDIAGRTITEGARFARDRRGATAIEYALIAGLIFLAVAGSLRYYATRVNGVYTQINTAVTQP